MDLPALPEHPAVAPQKALMGEAPAGVLHRRPGIAEVDINKIHLAGGEILFQRGGIPVEVTVMRMRKKKNLSSRMDACGALLVQDPAAEKGRWRARKPEQQK